MRLLSALALAALLAPQGAAQQVDVFFAPRNSVVEVGDVLEVDLVVRSDGLVNVQYSALDALLDYDPAHLVLSGIDDSDASESWYASAFLNDPDGINANVADGRAIYTALCVPGNPATAPTFGAVVTTLRFIALTETPSTVISLLPGAGQYASTDVYAYFTAGGLVTGDITGQATVQIISGPTTYCFGAAGACPCGNTGGPGEGCANSTGSGARLSAAGTTSVSIDDLVLTATQVPPNMFGLMYRGGGTNNLPFGDGLRCVSAGATGLYRLNPPTNAGPGGTLTRGPGLVAQSSTLPGSGLIVAGGTYYFQAWFRDSQGSPCGAGFNLSNGLQVNFTP
jgi:hypothetical protein